MKISSASKKVLASALSAAMVVAFAPTVAFGAGKAVTVTLDPNGGTYAAGSITSWPNAVEGDKISLPTITKGGYTGAWYYDANGDGEITPTTGSGNDAIWNDGTDALSKDITFKAYFSGAPSITPAYDATEQTITAQLTSTEIAKLQSGKSYTLSVKNPYGTELVKKANITSSTNQFSLVADFSDDATTSGDTYAVDSEFLVGGTYSVTLTDDKGIVVYDSAKTFGLVQLNITDTTATPAGSSTVIINVAGDPNLTGSFVDADGYAFDDTAAGKLKAGIYEIKKVASSSIVAFGATAPSFSGKTMTFHMGAVTQATDTVYDMAVTDPSGAVVWTSTQKSFTADQAIAISYDANALGEHFKSGSAQAGTYVLSVTKKVSGEAVATGKSKVTLTKFTISAGDKGTFASGQETVEFVDNATLSSGFNTAITGVTSNDPAYTVDYIDLNGKGKQATGKNEVVAGGENTYTVIYKAVDRSAYVADPTVASAVYNATDKNWDIKLACATAGAQLVYSTNGNTDANGYLDTSVSTYDTVKGIEDFTGATLYIQAIPVVGSTAATLTKPSNAVQLVKDVASWTTFAAPTGSLYKKIGKSTTTFAQVDTIKAALAAGQAAADAVVFMPVNDRDILLTEQAKNVYEATLAFAKAELAKYENGALVVTGDKAYTLTAKQIKTATDAFAAAEKTLAAAVKGAPLDDVASYKTAITTVVNALNTQLNAAADSGLAAADVQASEAVTAQLKAAKTGAEAQAAIEAYNKLSADQKKLVASADLAAAQEIAAAAELKDAQDEAAVAKTRNASKTVKAGKAGKTTKKQSVTLKSITSKSGAKVTYKKSSGSSKVTVKSGKAYLAKGVKKGTYKATVKATCGTQTAKIKVTFKVK